MLIKLKDISKHKIGSGDITWHEIIDKISKKNKPIIIATGASNMNDVEKAMKIILKNNQGIVYCNVIQIMKLLKITLIL